MSFTEAQRTDLINRIRRLSAPLAPRPTGIAPTGAWPRNLRAVIFDIYGTLFVSGAGDIGITESGTEPLYREAAVAAGLSLDDSAAAKLGAAFREEVKRQHAIRRAAGSTHPEVDVRQIWRAVLDAAISTASASDETILRFAVEVECRLNPVWPMPGALAAIQRLRAQGLHLGIVSNAQCFTPLLFDALLEQSIENLGFTPRYCVWSWREGEAKPAPALLGKVLNALAEDHGITPGDVAFVGNDMLNDVLPAAQAGCATALFAGDARSLRMREHDPRCANLHPTRILTHFDQA
ncbi:MAG: HAD family hydrolase [Kiritimatiellae bacterium]|nr:HAD family hydrolase [Kiritimatiellia bacterium]MCO5061172.1 HAD family hydrolase [Kiritimatiellia bacterium]MCO5067766.1 HAD family hydrolase [Kiritimatiellia bacterium]MCO6401399.1 HAD family hydrolase [Verrucomicrobiota bacterium]